MKKRRSEMKKGSSFLFVLLLALGLAITMSLYGWLLMLIIAFAPKMPPGLFPVLIVLYFGSLLVFGYFVYQRIELREERSILGDEVFFAMHPHEWKREVRRWKDVDTYRAVSEQMDKDQLPALLQLGYDASQEEIDALGIALKARTGEQGVSMGPSGVRHKTAYDELYYRAYPRKLDRKLRRLRLRRRIRELVTSTSQEPTLYELRLLEIRQKIESGG